MKPQKKTLKKNQKGFYLDGMGNILDHRQIFGVIMYNERIDKQLTETQLAGKAKLSRRIVDLMEEGSFQLGHRTWLEARKMIAKVLGITDID
jgi:hypothetical protein